MSHFVIGLDYGTDSVRALLVDTASGNELASAVVHYPRWQQGLYCQPLQDQFRQHPQDYLDSLQQVFALLWQHAERTLEDVEIKDGMQRVVDALSQTYNATLRAS